MAAVEQYRRLAVGSRQLQPPRGRLVSRLHLGDHAGKRAVTKGILGHGEHSAVACALRIEDLVRAKSYLFEARRIEVKLRDGPERRKVLFGGEAGRYARNEQRGCCVIVQYRASGGNFMQCRAIQAAIRKAFIERGDAER